MWRIRFALGVAFFLCAGFAARADLLSREDQQIYRAAFAAARSADWASARRFEARAHDPLPGKVLRWLELQRTNAATFADIAAFAESNLDWPMQGALRERAEQLSGDLPQAALLAYFAKNPPTTPQGKLHFADALAASGRSEEAIDVVRKAWLGPDLDPDTEQAILERFAPSLRPADHSARLDRLIWHGLTAAARRQLRRVPEDQRLLAEARLSLSDLETSAEELVSRVPEHLRENPGLLFERARWLRRKDSLEPAAGILTSPPRDPEHRAAWQAERQILARKLIDAGKDRLAYDVIAHRQLPEERTGDGDAEFLSGWIALRRLSEPKVAYDHFVRLHAAVTLPANRSRGAYWAGRAAEALGNDASRGWFATAAKDPATYYGQLAAARLGDTAKPNWSRAPQASADAIAAFDANELARAARMLSEIGESATAKPFLLSLTSRAKTPVEQHLVAALAERVGRLDVAVLAAKRASSQGAMLLAAGFPIIPVSDKGIAEKPLVLAITRQESAFDETAVSRSDARGLMQLRPSTAKEVAKSLSLPFSASRLLTDAGYNLTLGHAFLDKMLDDFGGSYVLSVAAYNAGPARVMRWLNAHGDPRGGAVDIVDWVELIPFGETRDYVQRVLENLQVYRLRLGDREHAFKLLHDLER